MTDRETPFLSPLRHRVLQVDGRRYSVRLEESYWAVLEELAGRRGLRLARIIDEVAAAARGEASLASALRLRCLGALGEKLADGLKASRAASGAGGRYTASLENLVTANPAPSLLIAHDGKILLANVAFQNWSGVKAEALVGQRYDWFFQLRLSHGLQETIDHLIHGTDRSDYRRPGRGPADLDGSKPGPGQRHRGAVGRPRRPELRRRHRWKRCDGGRVPPRRPAGP